MRNQCPGQTDTSFWGGVVVVILKVNLHRQLLGTGLFVNCNEEQRKIWAWLMLGELHGSLTNHKFVVWTFGQWNHVARKISWIYNMHILQRAVKSAPILFFSGYYCVIGKGQGGAFCCTNSGRQRESRSPGSGQPRGNLCLDCLVLCSDSDIFKALFHLSTRFSRVWFSVPAATASSQVSCKNQI